jgi:hypothetical protein
MYTTSLNTTMKHPVLICANAVVTIMLLSCTGPDHGPMPMDGTSKSYFRLPYTAKMDSQWSTNPGTRFEQRGVVSQGTKICLVRPPLAREEEWTHGLSLDGSEIWIRSDAVDEAPSDHICPPRGPT